MKNDDTLASHPLMKLAMDNLIPLLEEAKAGLLDLAQQGEVRSEGNATLPEYEYYDDDVFRNASALVDAFERMKQSQKLIAASGGNPWEGAGIDRHTWIEYHYSYYVVTLVSLADIALVLTNSVFRLGNRERDCKPDTIMRNWWVAQTSVKDALAELANLIQPHKEGRNVHVHRGKLQPIADVMGSKLLAQLKLFSFVDWAGKPVVDREKLEKGYNIELPKISAWLEQERTEIKGRLIAVLDGLYPVYSQKSAELHEKWKTVIEKKTTESGAANRDFSSPKK